MTHLCILTLQTSLLSGFRLCSRKCESPPVLLDLSIQRLWIPALILRHDPLLHLGILPLDPCGFCRLLLSLLHQQLLPCLQSPSLSGRCVGLAPPETVIDSRIVKADELTEAEHPVGIRIVLHEHVSNKLLRIGLQPIHQSNIIEQRKELLHVYCPRPVEVEFVEGLSELCLALVHQLNGLNERLQSSQTTWHSSVSMQRMVQRDEQRLRNKVGAHNRFRRCRRRDWSGVGVSRARRLTR